ncbi:hypothetical protein MTR_7g102250 [Medicago truncatula]|uniref:Uncharacterized protein n=1 Tax=Medicago truncatula TaxID=3880 RepID=G7L3X3_MEDTR|nr:hypothetical protein MTR_7g102250 [Medicago truncatula]
MNVGDYLGKIEGTMFEFQLCSECETILDRIMLRFLFCSVANHYKMVNGRSRSDEENLNPFCGNGVVDSSK